MAEPLDAVLEVIRRNEGREFLVLPDRPRRLTFGEFHESACRLAGRLESFGLGRGDRVLALLPNCGEYAMLYFAALYLGGVVVPVNPALHPRDRAFVLKNAGAKLLVYRGEAPAEGPALRWELPPWPWKDPPRRPAGGLKAEDLLTIVFTSGTTAFPKAVAHRAGSLIGNALAFNEAMGLAPELRFLHLFPMAYSGGFFNLLLSPFLAGASVVMTPGFGPRAALDFWRVPRRYGVNALWLNPAIAAALVRVDRDEEGREWCRRNIRRCFIGMAPLHLQVRRDFEARYGVRLYESYGLSETLLATAQGPGTGVVEDSVGPPLPGVRVSVRDDAGREASEGAEGEVFIHTPHLMAGTLDLATGVVTPSEDPEWFPTGDLGRLRPATGLSITGRKKDMILRAGHTISPRFMEEVLLQHRLIAEAAVVGVPSELAGEEIVAVLRLKPGVEWAREEAGLRDYCRTSFAPHARPAAVFPLDEFPTGATGKVLKKELREWAAARMAKTA